MDVGAKLAVKLCKEFTDKVLQIDDGLPVDVGAKVAVGLCKEFTRLYIIACLLTPH